MKVCRSLIAFIVAAGCLLFISESVLSRTASVVPGKAELYLYESGTGGENIGVKDIHASLGDTLTIDVFMRNFKQEQLTGIDFYLTFDDKYFSIVRQGTNANGTIQPFRQGEYMIQAKGYLPENKGNSTHGDISVGTDNGLFGWQLDYIELAPATQGAERPYSNLRYGVVATFQIVAKAPCEQQGFTLDNDSFNARVSRYKTMDSSDSFYFKKFQSCLITVTGIEINPLLPDIYMAPGTSDKSLDLDNYVGISSIPDSAFLWKATGNTFIQVSIDPKTHVVTFTAPADFHGYEDITFTVGSAGEPSMTSDTMRVIVNAAPKFLLNAVPDTIYIHEDSLETVFHLPDIVQDIDDDFGSLQWTFSTGQNLTWYVFGAQLDTLKLQGVLNFNGIDHLTMDVADPFGLGASITRPVVVFPVNDPPVLAGLPDVEFERTKPYTLNMQLYASDVDGDALLVTAVTPTNFTLQINGMVVTIREVLGFLGSEDIIFTVTDRYGLSASDTMRVTVTPLKTPPVWSKIPKIGFPQNQQSSELVLWDYVEDPDGTDEDLHFSFTGYDDVDSIYLDPETGRLYLYDLDNSPGWDRITVTATDADNNSASTQFTVFIAPDDGTPIVAAIPDTTIRAGTRFDWIDLDDYYYDINNTDDEMTWTWSYTSGDSLVSPEINSLSHIVSLKTVDSRSSGHDIVLFTATDLSGKSGSDDSFIKIVGDDERPYLDLPAKIGFVTGAKAVVDLDKYVYDPNFSNSVLAWAWSGNKNIKIDYEMEYLDYIKPLYLTSENGWTGWERVYFIVRNPYSDTSQDSTLVFSVPGDGSPVAGGLAQVSLKAGSCDSLNIDLDDYYFDGDTPERLMNWSFSGNDSVTVYIDPITHVVQFCSPSETYEGEEVITLTVTDGENSAYMDVKIVVYGAVVRNVFSMYLFRNPMQGDYMDVYIKSAVDLLGSPALEIRVEGDTTLVAMTTLSDTLNYYYGKYLLPYKASLGIQKDALVLANGKTTTKKSVQDTLSFVYGRLGASGGKLALGSMTLTVPEGVLKSMVTFTIVPEPVAPLAKDGSLTAKEAVQEIALTSRAYTIGPSSLDVSAPIDIGMSVCCRTDGACVFRKNGDSWDYVGSTLQNKILHASVTRGGTYCLGYDRIPPVVEVNEVTDSKLVFTAQDGGSGIDVESAVVSLDGRLLPYSSEDEEGVYTVNLPESSGTVMISIADFAGNTTEKTVGMSGDGVPEEFVLLQNVPNPFNPSTTITFVTGANQKVTIDIFDILGRKVRTLADSGFPAGSHQIVWDARDDAGQTVSSGTYFYRAKTAGNVITKKMVFIR